MNRRDFNRSLLGLFGVATVPGVSTERFIDPYVNRFTVEKYKVCSPECLEDMKNWGCFNPYPDIKSFYSKELINDC